MTDRGSEDATRPLYKEYAIVIAGAVGLVTFSAVSIWVANEAADSLNEMGTLPFISYMLIGAVFSALILILGLGLSFIVERPIVNRLKRQSSTIVEVTGALDISAKKYGDLNTKSEELVGNLDGILELIKDHQKVSYTTLVGSYSDIQEQLLKRVEEPKNKSLYIVGTMLGTYGDASLSISDQLIRMSRQQKQRPFSVARFGVPGFAKNESQNSTNSLYPFSARIAAAEILIGFAQIDYESLNTRAQNTNLVIHLHFLDRLDVFPAVQLWEKHKAMVLCSVGTSDRYDKNETAIGSIAKIMRVALLLEQEVEASGSDINTGKTYNLDNTLERIHRMFEVDFFASEDTHTETWELNVETGKIIVRDLKELAEEGPFLELMKRHTREEEFDGFEKTFARVKARDEQIFDIDEIQQMIETMKRSIEASFST